ncbi:MAG TPA: Mur ligase family protein, partial [Longimicrobiales bacterium]|nr:Mur ligase family protein [Longimicrobiales bacterium]
MTPLTYEALLHRLFPRLTGGVRWGLERTLRLLASVGDPHLACPVLHVGGTNGKGSVAAYLEASLRAAGLRTGLYTSPHLCTFRERVRVAGTPLPAGALVEAAERLWPALETEEASFFEATTALAFLALAEAGVDVAVVEVGLGGRLDATNVVRPRATLITNVALDHAEYLGDTLAAVAAEKAGILKPGVPAFTGAAAPEALAVLRRRASEVGVPLTEVGPVDVADVRTGVEGTRFRMPRTGWGELELGVPLPGAHQALNAALAVRALDALEEGLRPDAQHVVGGLASTRWPGRLQVVERAGRPWLFDVAHNVAG